MKQILAVTALNLRALPQRWSTAAVTMIGVASVVAVMTSMLAISAGLLSAAGRDNRPDQAVVMSSGAPSEYASAITPQDVVAIGQAPGVRRDAKGRPLVQPLIDISVELERKKDGTPETIDLQGSGPGGWDMAPARRIISGRMYQPGLRELVAGRSAAERYRGIEVGQRIRLRGTDWVVVGIFAAPGSLRENSLIADADTVRAALERPAYQSALVQLQGAAAFPRFKDGVTTNPSLAVDVHRASDYARDQMVQLTAVVMFVSYFVGAVMAVGAVFAALNTMQTLVDGRLREIATLQAVGFRRRAVVIAILLESQLLAISGAVLGSAIAYLLFNGRAFSTVGLTFPFEVSPALMVQGAVLSLVLGFLAGLAPSLRAAYTPLTTALRAD